MNKLALKKTDFGLVYNKDDKKTIKSVQDFLENLHHRYFNRRVKGYDLQWLIDLMLMTRRLGLGQREAWVKIYYSPYVMDHNQAFIEDSLTYLKTGQRIMTLQNWMDLIDFSEKKSLSVLPTVKPKLALPENLLRSHEQGQHDFVDTMDFIEGWCRCKDGPMDLFCTVFAIFRGHPFVFPRSHYRFPYHEQEA